jgi:predicted transcriptional regulator
MSGAETGHHWRFLTNHTQVLLCIARDPDVRLRDIAEQVGITERAAQRILADLIDVGAVARERHGRRNRYAINKKTEMRHAAQDGQEVGGLLDLLRFPEASKNSKSHQRHRD